MVAGKNVWMRKLRTKTAESTGRTTSEEEEADGKSLRWQIVTMVGVVRG